MKSGAAESNSGQMPRMPWFKEVMDMRQNVSFFRRHQVVQVALSDEILALKF